MGSLTELFYLGVDEELFFLATLVMVDTLYMALVPYSLVAQLVRAPH